MEQGRDFSQSVVEVRRDGSLEEQVGVEVVRSV